MIKTRIILTMLCVLSLGFTATAQSVSIGPRVGVNFATQVVTGDDSQYADDWNDEVKVSTGLQIGAVANFMISDMFSVQPELLYVQKGYKFEDGDDSSIGKYDYLDVPILAKISFGSGPLKGFVTAGPTLGYWTSGVDEAREDGIEYSEDVDFDDDGFIEKRFEAGASIGLGLAYNLGGGNLNFDVRYGAGLTSVYDSDDDAKLKNSGISLSVAYLFGL